MNEEIGLNQRKMDIKKEEILKIWIKHANIILVYF